MPTKVTNRSPGKPAMIWLPVMPTKAVPIRNAMASARAPMLIGSIVATRNMTIRPRMLASWGDMLHSSRTRNG